MFLLIPNEPQKSIPMDFHDPTIQMEWNGCHSHGSRSIFQVGKNGSKYVATPLWGKCEDETCTPKNGNLESYGTIETSELDCRGQNTLP